MFKAANLYTIKKVTFLLKIFSELNWNQNRLQFGKCLTYLAALYMSKRSIPLERIQWCLKAPMIY